MRLQILCVRQCMHALISRQSFDDMLPTHRTPSVATGRSPMTAAAACVMRAKLLAPMLPEPSRTNTTSIGGNSTSRRYRCTAWNNT